MKKVLSWVLALVMLLISLSGCSGKTLKKPSDTNLEFWITEDVTDFDFSEYYQESGWFGARVYYGSDYEPSGFDENNNPVKPDQCVIYKVTSYPDYSSNRQHIKEITITDPSITFYGLTLESDEEQIKEAMLSNGFTQVFTDDESVIPCLHFELNNISFRFYDNRIYISAEVTNKKGIQF